MAQSGRSPRNPASGAAKESEAFREFRPHPVMKRFLYAASFLTLALSVFPWSIPVTVFTDERAGAGQQAVEQASPDVATLLSRLLDEVRSIRDALTRDR